MSEKSRRNMDNFFQIDSVGSLISKQGILAGLFFFLLVVGSSLLYSWHVHRTTKAELEQTNRAVQTLENKNEAPHRTKCWCPLQIWKSSAPQKRIPIPMRGKQPLKGQTHYRRWIQMLLTSPMCSYRMTVVSEEESTEDVPVSPFGFGTVS